MNWNILFDYNGTDTAAFVANLLKNRNITDIEIFLNPPSIAYWFKNLPRELLRALKNSKTIIEQAIAESIPIIIHGDYDADGICATAILYDTLHNELGYKNVFSFIPNRFEHGYGLSKASIDHALTLAAGAEKVLFITVDSGITCVKEVEYIKQLGHKIIITDHHQKPVELPKADCIVWYDQIVGTTLSWLVSKILGSHDEKKLAYCALATVTDLQPVLDFNRTLVKKGLEVFNTSPPLGLKKLLDVAAKKGNEVTSYDLGWLLGPRLNASGRLVDAIHSLNLLLASDEATALELAVELNKVNAERQDKTLQMFELAAKVFEKSDDKIVISDHEEYHEGIIGLIAGKLAQKFYKPAIVISRPVKRGEKEDSAELNIISKAEQIAKGSARSIAGVNIIEMLREFSELFVNVGGHPMAAGFSIEQTKIPEFKKAITDYANKNIADDVLISSLNIDAKISTNLISLDFVVDLEKLKPFGLGNDEPVFASFGLGVAGVNKVGKESQHLSLRLFDGQNFYKAIGFNMDGDFKVGNSIDIAYTLKKNEFNGSMYIDLILKDVKNVQEVN